MSVHIEFIPGIKEQSLPFIKLTKSKNGKTGTASFLFILPTIFYIFHLSYTQINKVSLVFYEKKLTTSNIKIVFKFGKPFLIKAVFFFRNSEEWFHFLQFIQIYSKQSGLLFSQTNE